MTFFFLCLINPAWPLESIEQIKKLGIRASLGARKLKLSEIATNLGRSYYIAMKRAPDRVQLLKAMYEEEFERASAEDRDRSNLSLTPSSTYYGFV